MFSNKPHKNHQQHRNPNQQYHSRHQNNSQYQIHSYGGHGYGSSASVGSSNNSREHYEGSVDGGLDVFTTHSSAYGTASGSEDGTGTHFNLNGSVGMNGSFFSPFSLQQQGSGSLNMNTAVVITDKNNSFSASSLFNARHGPSTPSSHYSNPSSSSVSVIDRFKSNVVTSSTAVTTDIVEREQN
jgi:hypothetical protein